MRASTKETVRKEALARRNALTDEERAVKSLAICEAIMEHESFLDARGVHVYLPVRSEVDIKPLITLAWEMGKDVGLMRVQPDGGNEQFLIRPDTEYQPGPFGILEPVVPSAFDMNQCDVVLVPLVAADEQGNRLGYGKGYYDQFLSQYPRPTIGAAFDVQVFPQIPVDELDITLDYIATESRVIEGMQET